MIESVLRARCVCVCIIKFFSIGNIIAVAHPQAQWFTHTVVVVIVVCVIWCTFAATALSHSLFFPFPSTISPHPALLHFLILYESARVRTHTLRDKINVFKWTNRIFTHFLIHVSITMGKWALDVWCAMHIRLLLLSDKTLNSIRACVYVCQ